MNCACRLFWTRSKTSPKSSISSAAGSTAHRAAGPVVLTGSQESGLMRNVTESLAGRAAVLQLWPMSWHETAKVSLLRGGYPEVSGGAREVPRCGSVPSCRLIWNAMSERSATCKICRLFVASWPWLPAGTGQILNKSDLAAPLGMSVPGIGRWLDILEATAQILLVPPYFENLGKRLIKSPKIYLADSGLACHLLGIDSEAELRKSPFLGVLFEGFLAAEIVKAQINAGRRRELYYFRDQQGLEVDFVLPGRSGNWRLVETKAGKTVTPGMASPMSPVGGDLEPAARHARQGRDVPGASSPSRRRRLADLGTRRQGVFLGGVCCAGSAVTLAGYRRGGTMPRGFRMRNWRRWGLAEGAVFLLLALVATWPLARRARRACRWEWNRRPPCRCSTPGRCGGTRRSPGGSTRATGMRDFFPTPGTFAFSEPMPTTVVVAPLIWLGGCRILAYNTYIWLGLALNGWATFQLLRDLRLRWLVCLLGGGLVELLPLVHSELGVVQMVPLCGVLWTIHMLYRFRRRPQVKRAVLLGVAFAIAYLTCAYYGLFLSLLLPVSGGWLLGRRCAGFAPGSCC